jgi:hypothetical protein
MSNDYSILTAGEPVETVAHRSGSSAPPPGMSNAYSWTRGNRAAESSSAPKGRLITKENIMNHVTRRLTAGVVTAAIGSLAAAALASPASAGIIVQDVGGEPTSGTTTAQATPDYPPGPYRSALIPCL